MRRMSLVGVDLGAITDHDTYVRLRVPIKGGEMYDVPLDKRVWRATEPYRRALVAARGGERDNGPMFTRLQMRVSSKPPFNKQLMPGDRLTEDGLLRALDERAEAARVVDFSPHILRHTFVTWCRDADPPVEDQFIATVTGHAEQRPDAGASYPMIDRYTDKKSLAKTAARRCYEAVTARLTPES
jgi:integrase